MNGTVMKLLTICTEMYCTERKLLTIRTEMYGTVRKSQPVAK